VCIAAQTLRAANVQKLTFSLRAINQSLPHAARKLKTLPRSPVIFLISQPMNYGSIDGRRRAREYIHIFTI